MVAGHFRQFRHLAVLEVSNRAEEKQEKHLVSSTLDAFQGSSILIQRHHSQPIAPPDPIVGFDGLLMLQALL